MSKKWFTIPLLTACLLSSGTPATAQDWSQLKSSGDKALEQGDYKLAIKRFQKMLSLQPGHSDAQTALGFAFFKDRQFGAAAEQFRQAYRTNNNNRSAYNNLLISEGYHILLEKEDYSYEQSLEALQKLQKIHQNHPLLYTLDYFLGRLAIENYDYPTGLGYWQKTAEKRPNSAIASYMRAHHAHEDKNYYEALAAIDRAIELKKDEELFHIRKAMILAEIQRPQEALELLQSVFNPQRNQGILRLSLANLLATQGQINEAVKILSPLQYHGRFGSSVSLQLGYYYYLIRAQDLSRETTEQAFQNRSLSPILVTEGEKKQQVIWLDQYPVAVAPTAFFALPGRHQVSLKKAGKETQVSSELYDADYLYRLNTNKSSSLDRQKLYRHQDAMLTLESSEDS